MTPTRNKGLIRSCSRKAMVNMPLISKPLFLVPGCFDGGSREGHDKGFS